MTDSGAGPRSGCGFSSPKQQQQQRIRSQSCGPAGCSGPINNVPRLLSSAARL
ncbi:hypothetical protein ZHAS_00004289 [Anopheles sinensis]|uniref:Uncharacterized protein n=1 Tax=Anopheles sinensis TaxID=74873 RepID=A0A084VGI8_ANOSI|nr:hypothetical protein ZHAS_00004289 [Anopheles sinensis]